MKDASDKKKKSLLHNWMFWLVFITGIAIIIRSIPAWFNAAWGVDFGIYFGITKSVATNGEIFPNYFGWGSSYNYFPVLYAINVFANWITGIDVIVIMPKIMPIFGGLSVFVFYFIIYELFKNRKFSLISTMTLAVLPFHVYQTSHASPLTIGHFFMMLSLYFFIKFRQKNHYAIPLVLSTVLLIMSHHLTTYFYVIVLIFIVFFENATRDKWTETIKKDVVYILFTSIFVFSYWILIATPVFDSFMNVGISFGGEKIGPVIIILIFYTLFFLSFGVAKLVRRFSIRLIDHRSNNNDNKRSIVNILLKLNPFIDKPVPSFRSRRKIFLVALIFFICALIYFAYIPLPWTGFRLNIYAIIFTLPLLTILAFGIAGFRYTCQIKNGFFIRGWLFAILISLVCALTIKNTNLYPDRHFEYLMYPLSVLSAFGIGAFFSDPFFKTLFSKTKNKKDFFVSYREKNITITKKYRVIPAIFISVLLISLAVSVYPSFRALNQAWENISQEDLNTVEWLGVNLDKNNTIIASDHRLERMAESEGFNTTKDEAIYLWYSENLSDYIDELSGVGKNYSRITHVFIDDIMKNDGVQLGVFETVYMTNETWTAAYDKFSNQPFELIYRNETIEKNQITEESIHWAEVYRVNWTYLESII